MTCEAFQSTVIPLNEMECYSHDAWFSLHLAPTDTNAKHVPLDQHASSKVVSSASTELAAERENQPCALLI